MAPTRDRNGESERAAKRKRDKAETEEERRNRRKQKSKRKSLPEQSGQDDGLEVPAGEYQEKQPNGKPWSTGELRIVRKEESNGQLERVRSAAAWNVSKPIGGRMLDIDPVFSVDEV